MITRYFLLILIVTISSSCSTIAYTTYNIVTPTNVNPAQSQWVIDDPLTNIAPHFSSDIMEIYKKKLTKKFGSIKTVSDFSNLSSLNKHLKDDLQILAFYKEKTDYDYLVETEVKSTKNDLPNFQFDPDKALTDEIYIRIMVYDLQSGSLIHDKEFYFTQSFEGGNDFAFAEKSASFYKVAITMAITEFGKKYNWKYK